MTVLGAEKLREELEYLKSELRPKIIEAIAEARAHGDLKENAEYHAAREQQGFCEGRIQDIEGKLSKAQIIDVTKLANNGRVVFGATVTVLKSDTEEEITYRIVGDDEADIMWGSFRSIHRSLVVSSVKRSMMWPSSRRRLAMWNMKSSRCSTSEVANCPM